MVYRVKFENILAFTYGDCIYTSHNLPNNILIHEAVHAAQQRYSKLYGTYCLIRYGLSRKYRFECELEAHKAEIQAGEDIAKVARRMSNPVYGFGIDYKDIYKLLL